MHYLSMDASKFLELADGLVFDSTGKHLDDLEIAIIQGVCENKKYADIAKEYGYTEGHVNDVASNLWQVFSGIVGQRVRKANFRSSLQIYQSSITSTASIVQQINAYSDLVINNNQDRDRNSLHRIALSSKYLKDIPAIDPFYGRREELNLLKRWIEEECRSILIVGASGIGKTALARQLLEEIADRFDCVLWQSLACQRSPIEFIDRNLIPALPMFSFSEIPSDLAHRISQITEYLLEHRCLIILDDLDRLFNARDLAGKFAKEHDEYQILLKRVIETNHQGVLFLVGREEPLTMSGVGHILKLGGLGKSGEEIFRARGLSEDNKWGDAISYLGGNPYYLSVVAIAIEKLFGGRVDEFCKYPELFLTAEIKSILDSQFDLLSQTEREAIANLSRELDPVTISRLLESSQISRSDVGNAILSLTRRGLIERLNIDREILFTLSPIIKQYSLLSLKP
jgi:AAA ATPase domain